MLRANLAKGEAELHALESEGREIEEALPGLVAEPDRYVEAEKRLHEIGVLVPSKGRTVATIREAIPEAEEREEREALEKQVAEQAKKTTKLKRDVRARYNKAAEAYAAVLAEIKADKDECSRLKLVGSLKRPRVPCHHDAEWSLRPESNSWRGSVTDGVVVRDFDGRILFK